MAKLDAKSLEFAKRHIRHYYDSDFFPKPFEFDALWADWTNVLPRLLEKEITELPAPRPRLMAAPKPAGGYRIVHQLDPLAALIYTAFTYLVGPGLEAARAPVTSRMCCAYRLSINEANGGMFGSSTGYPDFIQKCHELVLGHSHVLVADISDFYNQVYLHRLQNVIAKACPQVGSLANDIEDYLLALNARSSKGIPVGPAASIVMAEAVLNDVDQMIQARGFAHTRYVDDFRVFSNSPAQLEELLRELTKYLYEIHRLTLSGHKTRILGRTVFVEKYLDSPDLQEIQETHEQLVALEEVADAYSDAPTPNENLTTPVIVSLMEKVCAREVLDLGLARHILRRCRDYRIRAIVPKLFERFSFFAPVMPSVVLYLTKVSSPTFIEKNVDNVAALYQQPSLEIPFVRMWFDHYTSGVAAFMQHPAIRDAVMNSPSMAARVTGALTRQDVAWVRLHRADLDAAGPSDRRQLMRATRALAVEERRAVLRDVLRNHDSIVDQAVGRWALR